MNCEEAQKHLSHFLDESLDAERSREIRDHFAACSRCREETAGLAECQRLVSSLPIVEPPVGFANRVMAEVREAANPPSLWQRLFLPLRIKIPLQATAVVLIAVMAAYIYQKEPLQRESVISGQPESLSKQDETDKSAPAVAQAPTAESELADDAKLRSQEFKDSGQRGYPQPLLKSGEQNKGVAGSQPDASATARAQNQVRSPATVSPTPPQENPSVATEAASPRLEQSSPSGEAQAKGTPQSVPQLVPRSEKESVSKDAAFAKESSEPVERSAASSLSPLSSSAIIGLAPPADHELAIRLKEPGRDTKNTGDRVASGRTQIERQSMTLQEEARNLERSREQALQTGQVQTIWISIGRDQYELLKKELADLGNIEVESSTLELKNDAVSKSSDRLRIKVTILPPLFPGNPTPPSQP